MESDYRFTPKEWQKLKYNVKDKSTGYTSHIGMLDRFPDLAREIPELRTAKLPSGMDRDLLIKYIIIYYSPTSPIHKINDLIERKKAAAIETGFPIENDRVIPMYEEVLFCKVKEANSMIISYLRNFKSTKFAMICAGTESLYNKLLLILNSAVDKGDSPEEVEKLRGELFKQAETIQKSLDTLTNEFLTDESPYLQEDLFSFVEKAGASLMLSPEKRHAVRTATGVSL